MSEQKTKTTVDISKLMFFLISENDNIDSLLNSLDKIARDCEPTEYGLPIAEPERAMLREAVLIWLANLMV